MQECDSTCNTHTQNVIATPMSVIQTRTSVISTLRETLTLTN
jgi:hypothetical protein